MSVDRAFISCKPDILLASIKVLEVVATVRPHKA